MIIRAYIDYFFKRRNAHGIHSPFVFHFYTEILKKARYAETPLADRYLKDCRRNNELLFRDDQGAGSRFLEKSEKIGTISKRAGAPKKNGKLLNRICRYYKYEKVLELGTSLGISAAYLADCDAVRGVITYEGCAETSDFAQRKLKKNFDEKVSVQNKNFDVINITNFKSKFDLIFIDGNHTYEATLSYYRKFKRVLNPNGLMIFDDIYWSEGMKQAWNEIAADKDVKVSIDLFRLGIISFREGQEKEHFILKY